MRPYFETKLGRLYWGNCLEIIPRLEPVDLTVTSPPYDNLRDYEGYTFEFEGIAKKLYRITKDGGIVVWVVGDQTINGSETGTSFRQALYFKDIGFNLHDTMIYKKRGTGACGSNYAYWQEFEYMFVLSKEKPTTINFITIKRIKQSGGSRRNRNGKIKKERRNNVGEIINSKLGNVWEYTLCGKSEHPAVFPEALAQDHILSWSNEYDIVLDPMAGSGTIAKICERLNRHWIGIEISEKYCEIAAKRIESEASQLKLFR